MYKFQRIREINNRAGRKGLLGTALAFSLIIGGCSTDVSRFDLGKYSGMDDRGATGSLPPADAGMSLREVPVPSREMVGRGAYDGRIGSGVVRRSRAKKSTYRGPDALAPSRMRAQRLSDISPSAQRGSTGYTAAAYGSETQTDGATPRPASPGYQPASRRAPAWPDSASRGQARLASSDSDGATRGRIITVTRGDTLYGLSRRHGVSIAALKAANGLRTAMIRPGQKLRLPGSGADSRFAPSPSGGALAAKRQRQARLAPASAGAVYAGGSNAGGSYKVRLGDSVYRIAREHGLKSRDLLAANPGINPRRLRPGQMLRIPGVVNARLGADMARRQIAGRQAEARAPRVVSASSDRDAGPRTFGKVKTRIINKKKSTRVASLRQDTMSDASPVGSLQSRALGDPDKRVSASKFRWPVKGRMIAKFGSRQDGTQNDGINILVPQGTAVKAAENGVVAYAGNELKGYGNLILLRHQDNWVTAYAHNSKLNVKRGDKVRRGQVIASAGTTGTVDRPQLHFELRKGSKPINPLPYLQQ